jgi:3-dehydroquinate dehydratase/shikimate dehydrogenase
MIAVSIGRGRHKMMIAEHKHLAEKGAELVELRLDYVVRAVNIKRLLADRPCPTIATCRREQDGGKWERSEDERIMALRSAIADGVDYVDLEEDVAEQIPRFGGTKRIISYHNFEETPENLREIHDRCASRDADIVKIATTANNPRDNLRVLQLISESETPTVALCMGDMGIPSRILAGKFGAPFTYATFHKERALAPGQLSYDEMQNLYHYDEISVDTEVYGVVADPIGHSLSPMIHNTAFRQLKMDKVYLPFRVPREDLADFLHFSRQLGVKGLSVTIPHKEAVVPHLTESDNAVDHIGAANTIVVDGFDKSGFNTDYSAALESIDASLRRGRDIDVLTGRSALVLGAGGVAMAIVYALVERSVEVHIASRTLEKSKALAKKFRCKAVPWNERHTVKSDMLVNCTPVGMHPHVNDSPYDVDELSRSMIVFDSIYNPEQTLLIKEARQKQCPVVTGVDMFVRQAVFQFKHFTGEDAPEDLMREAVRKSIGAANMEGE